MPRYYVQHEGKWNIFSTIVDDFFFDEFVSFEELKKWVLEDDRKSRLRELDTLLSDHPELNVMSYREAVVTKTCVEAGEQWQGDDDEFDEGINALHKQWEESGAEPQEFVQAVKDWLAKRGGRQP